MAELEVARHGKKAIKALGKRENKLAHRLGEMALEIFTIVFAVTLSIWLHGLSEHRHEQQQVKTFLVGLKEDLQRDIELIGHATQAYRSFDANFRYLASLDPAGKADPEQFDPVFQMVDANFFFEPQMSRFDGFKSSGKLINIENEKLLNDILTLYQVRFRQIEYSQGGWQRRHQVLRNFLEERADSGDSAQAHYATVTSPKGKRLLNSAVTGKQLYERYDGYASLAREIIADIDRAYPELAKTGVARQVANTGAPAMK